MATAPVSNSISSPLLHLCPLSPEAGSFFNLESTQDGSWLLCQQQLLLTGLTVTQEAISRSDCRPQGTTASSLAWPRAPASKTPAGCCQGGLLEDSSWSLSLKPRLLLAALAKQSPADQAASAVGSCVEAQRPASQAGGWECKVKVSAGLVAPEAFPWLVGGHRPPCSCDHLCVFKSL